MVGGGRDSGGRDLWIGSVVFDCSDLARMIPFWAGTLAYVPRDPPGPDGVVLTDPRGRWPNLSLFRTSERPLEEYRLHLDLCGAEPELEVKRLTGLGAGVRLSAAEGQSFVTLADPDGNPFDVVLRGRKSRERQPLWIDSIVLNCSDLRQMRDFWTRALGFVPGRRAEVDWIELRDPAQASPAFQLALTLEDPLEDYRIHLDLYSAAPEQQVDRLLGLGATRKSSARKGRDFVTLADPDGNVFDVVDKRGWAFGRRS